MSTERLTASEVAAFAQRLDAFVMKLTLRERDFLTEVLRDAEGAQPAHTDSRTAGDIAVAIHRMRHSPEISLNPQPIPPGLVHHQGE